MASKNLELIIPGNYETTLNYCVENFKTAANRAIKNHGSFYVALSGGETPRAIFQKLALEKSLPWNEVHLFWSDERCVPPTCPDSNYHMAQESGLLSLIKPENIHRMRGENDPEKEALRYEQLLRDSLPEGRFDLVMLGIGEDGHTASLFPNTAGLNVNGRLVIANFVPQKDAWRLSLTFDCINASREIVVYALGARKAKIIEELFNSDNPLPIRHIGSEHNKAKVIWNS